MTYGFFNTSPYEKKTTPMTFSSACGSCGLYKNCQNPKMRVEGLGKKRILLLFENPTKKQDYHGNMIVGKSMIFLKKTLKKFNINIKRDCYMLNAIQCCPHGDGREKHVQACRPKVFKEIKKLKPKIIICFGTLSINSITAHRYFKGIGSINKWRGYLFPDFENNCWIGSTFDPNFVRTHKQAVAKLIFETDLKNALSIKDKTLPDKINWADNVVCLTEPKKICGVLNKILKINPPLFAFDYETTGLKPHSKGHEIVSCSFCCGPKKAYSFPMADKKVKRLFVKILKNKNIHKIAANLKMEETWSRVILNQPVNGWIWDTMLASHCLDNRKGVNSLKFHALTHFGIWDYDSHIDHLLKSDDSSGNGFNKIHQIDMSDLLIYNGIDAILEYNLALHQMLMMGIIDPVKYAKTGRVRTDIDMFEANQTYIEKMERKRLLRKRTKNKADIRRK